MQIDERKVPKPIQYFVDEVIEMMDNIMANTDPADLVEEFLKVCDIQLTIDDYGTDVRYIKKEAA